MLSASLRRITPFGDSQAPNNGHLDAPSKQEHDGLAAEERRPAAARASAKDPGGSVAAPAADRKWFLFLIAALALSFILLWATRAAVMGGDMGGASVAAANQTAPRNGSTMWAGPAARGLPPPPVLAYSITGATGDVPRIKRLLEAIYHPRNEYVVHLDLTTPPAERAELARFLAARPVLAGAGNVHLTERSSKVTYRGVTMLATYLQCAAALLRRRRDWDWFINLSASDYPLMPQDDLLHVLSYLPRDINFIEHNSHLNWKEEWRVKPIAVDPGLYSNHKQELFFPQGAQRALPDAFKLFEGSAWIVATRAFVEYCVWGWDSLPRRLLLYVANFVSCPEVYFQTVLCGAPQFRNTSVNHDLHYIKWDRPPKQHPQVLGYMHFPDMVQKGVPFARKFPKESELLDKVDAELLGGRQPGQFVRGAWCAGSAEEGKDPCWEVGDVDALRPGPGAARLERKLLALMDPSIFRKHQCSNDAVWSESYR